MRPPISEKQYRRGTTLSIALACVMVIAPLLYQLVPRITRLIPEREQQAAPPAGSHVWEQPPAQTAAEKLLSEMTLREKLCQMLIVRPQQLTGGTPMLTVDEAATAAVQAYPVGGFLLDARNIKSREQLAGLTHGLATAQKVTPFLTCDEEGGRVARLMTSVGTTRLDAMLSYRGGGTEVAFQNGRTIATDMRALGFQLDLAPVADVWSNPVNSVIGDRAYSTDFKEAALLVGAAVSGFHEGGVACTLKHFPGHGDTVEDSHYGMAQVTKSLDELRAEEFQPFIAGIRAGADAVMIGHLTVPAIEPELPALFSKTLVSDILRGELGFRGLVLTDGLDMQAITNHYTTEQTAVQAVQAGVDMLLCPNGVEQTLLALEAAVAEGTITEARIDESVSRILGLKYACNMIA